MTKPAILVLTLAFSFPAGLSCPAAEPAPNASAALARNQNRFALDLYQSIRERDGNLFLSPYSIAAALRMTASGARGETEADMQATLHTAGLTGGVHTAGARLRRQVEADAAAGTNELDIANALWIQHGADIRPDFQDLMETRYEAGIRAVDFAREPDRAAAEINRWVSRATQGRIPDLVPPGAVGPMTRLILANAIYFKGLWATPFDKADTVSAPFHTPDGQEMETPFMHNKLRAGFSRSDRLDLLELPYAGDHLSMAILLPRGQSLADLESSLTPDGLAARLKEVRRREVDVYLPRFRITTRFSLAGTLQTLGMKRPFSRKADFSGMSRSMDLFLSDVIHKAFVEIDEKGTEAAAATAVTVVTTALRPPPPVFRADRPFLFLIRHRPTGAILFLGRLENPQRSP